MPGHKDKKKTKGMAKGGAMMGGKKTKGYSRGGLAGAMPKAGPN